MCTPKVVVNSVIFGVFIMQKYSVQEKPDIVHTYLKHQNTLTNLSKSIV